MQFANAASRPNLYNILGVPSDATERQIKFARDRLALRLHPDRGGDVELMQKVNKAFEVLSDPVKRADYDNTREDFDDANASPTIKGYLHCGHKLSSDFIAKINNWRSGGIPATDKTRFKDHSSSIDPEDTKPPPPEARTALSPGLSPALSSYQKLISSNVPSISTILSQVISADIWNWTFKIPELMRKEILNSPLWQQELPPSTAESPLSQVDYRSLRDEAGTERNHVRTVLSVWDLRHEYVLPNVEGLKTKLAQHLQAKSSSIFKSTARHPPGTKIPLCPESMKNELGYIPQHVVQANSAAMDNASCNCVNCSQSFGLFLWKSNCAMCGNASCNDCLGYNFVPDYVSPVQVCQECKPKVAQEFGSDWMAPLEDSDGRKTITSQYLSLIWAQGYAYKDKFLELADLFLKEQRYDLAIQCYLLVKGDWMELASKFVKDKQYYYANACLKKIENKTNQWWSSQGDAFSQMHPDLALLAYRKAGFKAADYIEKAFQYSDKHIGKLCLLAALESARTSNEKNSLLDIIFSKAMEQDKALVAIYSFFVEYGSNWIKYINKVDIGKVEPFLKALDAAYDHKPLNWQYTSFSADRDHLRWQFMQQTDFDIWLGYLIKSFEQGDIRFSIPYFRARMKDENFVVRRDEYLAKGEYAKALICHRLIQNGINWMDLAKKWGNKDETASLACIMLATDDLVAFGDRMFQEGNTSLALRCYLQSKNYAKIEDKIKIAAAPIRLHYQIALWNHDSHQNDVILDICRTLLADRSNVQAVQKILIAALKNSTNKKKLPYHQMLVETGISEVDLVGLVETVYSLCQKPNEKSWLEQTLAMAREKVKDSLRRAIYYASLKEAVALVDGINPLTWTAVKDMLAGCDIDYLERGPIKATALLVRAAAYLVQVGKSRYLDAMNDITEAMLCDPAEESLPYYAQMVEKISQHTGKAWNLCGAAATSLHKRNETEFLKRLKSNPILRMLSKTDQALAKFKPYDAAMAYIDRCEAIPYAPGVVGGYLSAALELSKGMKDVKGWDSTSISQQSEQYAYRQAVVELVNTAYSISHTYLCPASQLYVIRTGIAILTSAYNRFFYISESEQNFIDELYKDIDQLSKLSPFALGRIVQMCDLVYLDLVNREVSSKYFPLMRALTNKTTKPDPKYQYHIFEERWKGNFDEKIFKFEEERQLTMQALLRDKGLIMGDVEALMQWPAIVRDSDGWLPEEPLPLNLTEDKYSRIAGIRFDMDKGEIDFLLETSEDPMASVVDMDDIADAIGMRLTSSEFTLVQPDPQQPSHPCQKMLFAPNHIGRSNHLATLLHADMLLKMLTTKTEVSAKAPFALRDAEEGLLKRLPDDLRKEFLERYKDKSRTANKVSRFWIEAGILYYGRAQYGHEVTYTFGDCTMSVKKHKMMRDREGNLVDAPEDYDKDAPEAKMADLLTKAYPVLAQKFPELKRLEELAKIQAMVSFALKEYQTLLSQSAYIRSEVEKDRILRVSQAFQRTGFISETLPPVSEHRCTWVPATFKMNGNQRIYGGVSLHPRYVESMDSNGVRRGHAYTVNSVNNQMDQFLYLKSSVLDVYNSNMRRPPNITALWSTRVGYTDVHHYTHHTNGYRHVHYTNGWTDCQGPQGAQGVSRYYPSGDPRHRCGGSHNG